MPVLLPLESLHAHPGPVLVGFSGGLDSSVLLHWLAHTPELRTRRLSALHIHHGLHPAADAWQQHCQQVCAKWQVPLHCIRVNVCKDSGHGLEAAARHARHAAFAAELPSGGILALAHHQDDQAETVLLRALRGSGVEGLAAMRPWRTFADGWLWRPLLDAPRARLIDYAHAHGLNWVEDSSNSDPQFDRNWLRHEIMPRLNARWPHAAARLAHVATLQGEALSLLEADTRPLLTHCLAGTSDTLSVSRLLQLPAPRRALLLRAWVQDLGLPPLRGHAMTRIETTLLHPDPGPYVRFRWQQAELIRWRDLLHAGPVRAPLPPGFACRWNPSTALDLPGGAQLVLTASRPIPADLCWQVHARCGGERITLPGRRHSHTLKHVLQQRAIPPWIRTRLPLLSDSDGTLLAAGDQVHSAAFAHWLRAHQAQLRWVR